MAATTTEDTTSTTAAATAATTSSALNARELAWAVNSNALVEQHQSINGTSIRTRFPPEPNGYLHIGHAKSMNMNFRLAFEKLQVAETDRRTVFRYDDTNPDAETAEYIDSLLRDVQWLGWTPEKTTYSSDHFETLYELAVQLIDKGLAYVCDMTKAEMEAQRELAYQRVQARNQGLDPDTVAPIVSSDVLPGRNRDTSVERNRRLFERMRMGFYKEGEMTLRLKMDFESSNPNMFDLVAYRVKYTPHPHAGSGWCIYPSYDFTHGICDSLEHIDYSICTLEFEARREPYYWILWALDLYRPKVYEMSRLNISYTVLSKRRLIKLVDAAYVRGWDDPRMPTVSGLRRRGLNPTIVNRFCQDVGATRAQNLVDMSKLMQTARQVLAPVCCRVMAVLEPIRIVLTNYAELDSSTHGPFAVANVATDDTKGSHTIAISSNVIYIDASDFRFQDSKEYYGLAPNKAVGLKYHGGNMVCDAVVYTNASGDTNDKRNIKELHCHVDLAEDRPKPKTYISWVPENSVPAEVRVYGNLFTVPEPTDLWEDELNSQSEIVYPKALVDPSVNGFLQGMVVDKWQSGLALQFERLGYFVVDYDTTYDASSTQIGKLVFNRTVSLKEDVVKNQKSDKELAELAARRERAQVALAAKEKRMAIAPADLFRLADEYVGKYSQYNAEGVPTHDADGKDVSKSMMKKLAKEQQKHVKQVKNWKPN